MFSLPPEPRRGFLLRRRRDAFVSNRSRADSSAPSSRRRLDRDGGVRLPALLSSKRVRAAHRAFPRRLRTRQSAPRVRLQRRRRATQRLLVRNRARGRSRRSTRRRAMRRRAMRRRGRRRRDERLGDRDGGVRSRSRSRVGGGEGGGARDGASLSSRRASSDASRDDGGPVLNRRDRARLVRGGGGDGGDGGGGGGGTSIHGRRGGWGTRERTRRGGVRRRAGVARRGEILEGLDEFGDGFVARDGIARRKRVGLRGHVGGASNERCAVDSRRLGGFRGKRARSGNGRGARGRRGTRLGDETRVDGRRRRGRVDRPRRRRGPRGERCRTSELLDAEGALHQSPELPHGADGWGVVVQPWTTPRIAGAERRRANSRTWNVRVFTDASPGGERCAL